MEIFFHGSVMFMPSGFRGVKQTELTRCKVTEGEPKAEAPRPADAGAEEALDELFKYWEQ